MNNLTCNLQFLAFSMPTFIPHVPHNPYPIPNVIDNTSSIFLLASMVVMVYGTICRMKDEHSVDFLPIGLEYVVGILGSIPSVFLAQW